VLTLTIVFVIDLNIFFDFSSAILSLPEMICGKKLNSLRALPSIVLSGQKEM
jgi:hypothetical protein